MSNSEDKLPKPSTSTTEQRIPLIKRVYSSSFHMSGVRRPIRFLWLLPFAVAAGVPAWLGLDVIEWDQVQLGPLSGWVSGAVTGGALFVALWMGLHTRREAEANKRSDQAKTISPIWSAVVELETHYKQYAQQRATAQSVTRSGTQAHHTASALEQLKKNQETWNNHVRAVELAFEPALLTVVEPITQRILTQAYEAFDRFANQCTNEYHDVRNRQPQNFKESEQLLKRLVGYRRPVVHATRVHLLRAPALRLYNEPDS